jgi:hypothetical protein
LISQSRGLGDVYKRQIDDYFAGHSSTAYDQGGTCTELAECNGRVKAQQDFVH